MSKPDITLEPSKGVVSEAAARIYAAYIAAGRDKDDAKTTIRRSVREAVAIARTVDASVESRDSLAIEDSIVVRPKARATKADRSTRKARTDNTKSRKPRKVKRRSKKEALEDLAEEVLMDDDANKLEAQIAHEKSDRSKAQVNEDAATTAEELLKRTSGGISNPGVEPKDAS